MKKFWFVLMMVVLCCSANVFAEVEQKVDTNIWVWNGAPGSNYSPSTTIFEAGDPTTPPPMLQFPSPHWNYPNTPDLPGELKGYKAYSNVLDRVWTPEDEKNLKSLLMGIPCKGPLEAVADIFTSDPVVKLKNRGLYVDIVLEQKFAKTGELMTLPMERIMDFGQVAEKYLSIGEIHVHYEEECTQGMAIRAVVFVAMQYGVDFGVLTSGVRPVNSGLTDSGAGGVNHTVQANLAVSVIGGRTKTTGRVTEDPLARIYCFAKLADGQEARKKTSKQTGFTIIDPKSNGNGSIKVENKTLPADEVSPEVLNKNK